MDVLFSSSFSNLIDPSVNPECAFDIGDCGQDIELLPKFDDSISNHNAKQIYANYKLTRMFGGKERARYPHVPIMINRDIMEGMSFLNLIVLLTKALGPRASS